MGETWRLNTGEESIPVSRALPEGGARMDEFLGVLDLPVTTGSTTRLLKNLIFLPCELLYAAC